MSRDKYRETYRLFTEAIAQNNTGALATFIDTDTFLAMLPGIEEPLTFWQFVAELDHQRRMFSNFGKHVEIKDVIVDDNRLGASYVMTVLNDGPLTNREGRGIPATNKTVAIKSMDLLTYNKEGKIVHIVVVSDRMGTLMQLA